MPDPPDGDLVAQSRQIIALSRKTIELYRAGKCDVDEQIAGAARAIALSHQLLASTRLRGLLIGLQHEPPERERAQLAGEQPEATRLLLTLVQDCQAVLAEYLALDGIRPGEAIDKLFELLDGPRWREAEEAAAVEQAVEGERGRGRVS